MNRRSKPLCRVSRVIWQALRPLMLAYLIVLLMLSLFERMLVFPAPLVNSADWSPVPLSPEDVYFEGSDGVRLHGWYLDCPNPRGVVLYSHGNGEHVAHLAPRLGELRDLLQLSVFAWDYRGYGKSEGKPHERNVINDAREAQLWLAERAGVDPKEVVLIGRSLGGAVAVQLARRHPVRALVLERTFAQLVEVAAYHFPWLPVRWIMRNEFRSIEHIAHYNGPLLQVHGTLDEVVPFEQGERLFQACPSKFKRFIRVEGGIHNDPLSQEYDEALAEFLDALAPIDAVERGAENDE